MKKKLFFTFVTIAFLMAGVISCTNEYFEEELSVATKSKSIATRTGVEMTKEEVLARLDKIGKKYGININMLYARDYSEFTEKHFEELEQYIIKEKSLSETIFTSNTEDLIDDSIIDEFNISPLSVDYEEISKYEETLEFDIKYQWGYYNYMYDIHSYVWGLKFNTNGEHVSVNSTLIDVSYMDNVTVCNIGPFHNDFISVKDNNNLYFQFDFSINIVVNSHSFCNGYIYGTFDNGFQNVYLLSYEPRLSLIR